MNTPNKLTLFRIILTPVFLAALIIDAIPHHYLFAMIIFIAASLTDLIDGQMARKNDQITNFGKFLDPLADKILIVAAFAGLVELGISSSWVVLIVIAREFMVTSLRMIAVNSDGNVIAANIWGKLKTVTQMTAVIATLAALEFMNIFPAITDSIDSIILLSCNILIWISAGMTFISGLIYLIDYWKYIDYRS